MSIETKQYIATVDDIRKLVRQGVNAEQGLASTRGLYFRTLIGTCQAELGADTDQLKALKALHKRFYPVVLEAVTTPDIAAANHIAPEEKRRRALERNRRSNFARSAMGTIRRWLQVSGHDLRTLKPAKASKAQLEADTPKKAGSRKMVPEKAQERVRVVLERMLTMTRALADAAPEVARETLNEALNRIGQELFAGAVTPTTNPVVSTQERRPLRVGKAVFWPTESQILRRQRLKAAA